MSLLKKLNEKQLIIDDENKNINMVIRVGSSAEVVTFFGEIIFGRIEKVENLSFYMRTSDGLIEVEYEDTISINGQDVENYFEDNDYYYDEYDDYDDYDDYDNPF